MHMAYFISLIVYIPIAISYIFPSVEITSSTEVTANDDYAEVDLNMPGEIYILANDYGLNDGIASLSIITYPQNGDIVVNDDNTLTYTPDDNYVGLDEFEYEICNSDGECGEATVSIEVVYVDYQPIAINDSIYMYWTAEKNISCMDNDSNLLNTPIELYIDTDAEMGYAYTLNDSILVYCPDNGNSGIDSIQYTVYDEDGDYCSAWVIITLYGSESTNDIFIPNGFSPNDDGINDNFYIPEFVYLENIQVQIFTRWGEMVYQSSNYDNNWDAVANIGVYKGSKLTQGTYFFRFKQSASNIDLKGYVYINY